jgi:tetratricopeptide (TPR) repeat protein
MIVMGIIMIISKNLVLLVLVLPIFVFARDMCNYACRIGDYKNASDCYIQELKKHKTVRNNLRAGISLEKQGRFNEALPYLKEAEKLAEKEDDFSSIYNNLGIVYGTLGEKKYELVYHTKYLEISLKMNDKHEIGTAYNNLGIYYSNVGDYNKSLDFFSKSLNYSEINQNASTYRNIATSYNKLNNYEKAEEYYKKSINLRKKINDQSGLCMTENDLGQLYLKQKKYVIAQPLLKEASDICDKMNYVGPESRALASLAYLYFKTGNTALANEYINRAIPLAKQSEDATTLNDVLYDYKVIEGQIKE